MLDRLFSFFSGIIDWFIFWAVIDSYEEAVVMRFGNPHRKWTSKNGFRGTGLHFHIPFGVEEVMNDTVVERVIDLPSQSLVTKDGISVGVSAVVTCKIIDVQKALLNVENVDIAIVAAACGAIGDKLGKLDYDELLERQKFKDKLKTAINSKLKQFGVECSDVQLDDFCKIRNIRLHGLMQ